LENEIHQLASVGQEAEYLLEAIPKKQVPGLSNTTVHEEVRTCIEKLKNIVKSLFDSNYKDEAIESKLSEFDLLVKSACLLDRIHRPDTEKRHQLLGKHTQGTPRVRVKTTRAA
jgi:hypothetical protein